MSQEIRKARLREIAQQYRIICLKCRKSMIECGCRVVPIAFKRAKEGLGAVRD